MPINLSRIHRGYYKSLFSEVYTESILRKRFEIHILTQAD